MDFTYNDEQRMLTDSVRKLVSDAWTFEARRARASTAGLDRTAWGALAELGVAGLLVPQEYDGFGESPATLIAVQFELGRGLVSAPVIPSAVIATTLLAHCGNPAAQSERLPAMATGEDVTVVAWLEPGQRDAVRPQNTLAHASATGYVLSGKKHLVWSGGAADHFLVTALLEGDLAVFQVPAAAAGVTVDDYPTMDRYRCASVSFNAVALPATALVVQGEHAESALGLALDYGVTAVCAHAAGAMERLVEITSDYLKTRRQFGRPLADFQVLQHRLADMLLHKELAASMAYVAAVGLAETDPAERQRLVSSAKVAAGDAGRYVGENAVQLHGGIGVTDELEVGDYFKRLIYTDYLLGSADFHLSRLETLLV
ncbi:MAG: acyl-CoA dehydrogenase [Alcaligenaceae bacterium]|nr:acyl-CoA dehydrogenase [Alcaligenaceae bacterium]